MARRHYAGSHSICKRTVTIRRTGLPCAQRIGRMNALIFEAEPTIDRARITVIARIHGIAR